MSASRARRAFSIRRPAPTVSTTPTTTVSSPASEAAISAAPVAGTIAERNAACCEPPQYVGLCILRAPSVGSIGYPAHGILSVPSGRKSCPVLNTVNVGRCPGLPQSRSFFTSSFFSAVRMTRRCPHMIGSVRPAHSLVRRSSLRIQNFSPVLLFASWLVRCCLHCTRCLCWPGLRIGYARRYTIHSLQ